MSCAFEEVYEAEAPAEDDPYATIRAGLDMWAIQIVVREGRYMPLTRPEQFMAAHLMRKKGLKRPEMAFILRVSDHGVDVFLRNKPPVPVSEIDPGVIGAPVIEPPTFPRLTKKRDRASSS